MKAEQFHLSPLCHLNTDFCTGIFSASVGVQIAAELVLYSAIVAAIQPLAAVIELIDDLLALRAPSHINFIGRNRMHLSKKRLVALSVSMSLAFTAHSANALSLFGAGQTASSGFGDPVTAPAVPAIVPAVPDILPALSATVPAIDSTSSASSSTAAFTDAAPSQLTQATSALPIALPELPAALPLPPAPPALPLIAEGSVGLPNLSQPATLVSDALATDPFNAVTLDLSGTELLGDKLLALNVQLGINLLGLSLNLHLGTDGNAVTPVPEPSTYAMMGVGLLSLLMVRRRKERQS